MFNARNIYPHGMTMIPYFTGKLHRLQRSGWGATSSGFWDNLPNYAPSKVLDEQMGTQDIAFVTPAQAYHWLQVNFLDHHLGLADRRQR